MTDFYKMDPADWDNGTARLTLEEEAAYLRIVNSIHKHKAPVPDVDRVLAGMFRTSTRKARALVNALMDAGKIVIEGGSIWNDRARSDLVHRGFVSISRAESGAKGGRTRAINAAKALENIDASQAIASSREEKRREEKSIEKREANASPKNRGARLSADWFLPMEWGEWALTEGMDRDAIRIEAERFRDYWCGKAGQQAVKLDWLATWRNWIRTAKERGNGNRTSKQIPKGGKRPDPALEQIARLAGLGATPGDGSGGAGSPFQEGGSLWMGPRPQQSST
jgi:uncharacterized protein YdaU (DUF1376 family)